METDRAETSVTAHELYSDPDLAQFWHLLHLLTLAHVLRQLPSEQALPLRLEIAGPVVTDNPAARRKAAQLSCHTPDRSVAARVQSTRSGNTAAVSG